MPVRYPRIRYVFTSWTIEMTDARAYTACNVLPPQVCRQFRVPAQQAHEEPDCDFHPMLRESQVRRALLKAAGLG
jgi:hypothetical protein